MLPVALGAQAVASDSGVMRERQVRHTSPASTVVLTRAELHDTPAQTLDDVLRTLATVNLPAQGSLLADPATSSASMRGLAGTGVLVLLDGVPLHDSYFGTVNWRKIPVEQVERVEIVHGSAASQYAANAVAGVILITSRKPTHDMVELQGAFGTFLAANSNPYRRDRDHNTGRVNLLASKAVNSGARLTVNANYTGTKGAWLERGGDDSFTRLSSATGSARLDLQPTAHSSAYVQLAASAILPQTLAKATDDFGPLVTRRIDTRSVGATAGLTRRQMAGGTVQADAFYDRSRRWRTAGFFGAPSERTPTDDGGVRVTWSSTGAAAAGSTRLMLGADVRWIGSDERLSADSALPLDTEARNVASGTTRMLGVFAEREWSPAERLIVRTGLRVDGFQSTGWQYALVNGARFDVPSRMTGRVSPAVRVSYALLPALIVRASAYAGSNPPTHLALAPTSGASRAPVAVAPEHVIGGEFGVDLLAGPVSLFANVFQQNLRDGITTEGTEFDYAQANGERRRSRGIEIAGEWSPRQSLSIRASHTYLSAYITANPFEGPSYEYFTLVGNRDENVPIHTFAGGVRSSLPGGLRAMLRGRYQSRYTRTPQIGFGQPAPLAVLDASLIAPLTRELELSLRGENVLNRRYGITSFRQYYRDAAPSLVTLAVRLTPMR